MLKALELSGFKSFADRTRFEFPAGVSVIVGPNGSGKSNLVDAVKWVLGSQSAKSLRGKEMTDVIFNGAASRGPSGTGEVTITLSNDDGRLALDAKEVHITRRVYRSGEGEYLINREPCRLRDIRDLLAGTGITTEAYCIIEQGKVDALLQSSPRDRRVIFEEAAGISQFKAKKAAAMRRLERVEQNLLRLSDIVDEVESRLRSVRSQAGKARRYRESTERLRHLRTQVGLVDWQLLTNQITTLEVQLAELRRRVEERAGTLQETESQIAELDHRLQAALERLRESEALASANRERIAAGQAAIEHQRARHAEILQEVARIRRHLAAASARRDPIGDPLHDATAELRVAEQALSTAAASRQQSAQQIDQSQRELDQSRLRVEHLRTELERMTQATAQLNNRLITLDSQLASSQAGQEPLRRQLLELARERDARAAEADRHDQGEALLRAQVELHQQQLQVAEQRLAHARDELARADKQYRQLDSSITRARERVAVLTELEQRWEGLDGGVQKVLRMAREDPAGPFADVRGVVADLFHVDVDTANLIEAALGERAQYLVVASAAKLFERLQQEPLALQTNVGFLRLDTRQTPSALDHVDLSSEMGVMGRADRFVEAPSEFAPLVQRLLGRTWLVDRLGTALRLAQSAGRGLDFVTSDGELLAADGTLIVGPRSPAAGLMSRRSELRACQEQVHALEAQLEHSAGSRTHLDAECSQQDALVATLSAAQGDVAAKWADCRREGAAAKLDLERIARDWQRAAQELEAAEQRIAALGAALDSTKQEQSAAEANAAELHTRLAGSRQCVEQLELRHAHLQAEFVEQQIAAAKYEQRVEMLRQQWDLARRNLQQRDRAIADNRDRLIALLAQAERLEDAMLAQRQELADLLLRKEAHLHSRLEQASADELLRAERSKWANCVYDERQQLATAQSQQHKLEVTISRLRYDREALCERMRDDYGIDLAEVARTVNDSAAHTEPGAASADPPASRSPFPTSSDRAAADREISALRNQINTIGAVNLEALDELDQLEMRFSTLSAQYRDLVDAKASLERIVQRINADSRQLFLATLELVRGHFQQLFRRLFGGGEADIVVDQADDVLECGIEVMVRPPGKEACSISLLSGGEKTLTCVALLLAVFRSKPSPFCVLDEVDAALDEANIGRFTGVLREFLSFTRFLVVTHSKKTMSGADTLYGITMEESGVSKRVSVRFEDVSEDGHILPPALGARQEPPDSSLSADPDDAAARRAA